MQFFPFRTSIASVTLGLLVAGCAGALQTASETSAGASLKKYRSYAFIAPQTLKDSTKGDNRRFATLIYTQAEKALERKHMQLDTIQPDAVFIYRTSIQERVSYSRAPTTVYSHYYGGPGFYPGYGPPVPAGEVLPKEYDQGMISFEMYDRQTKELLWHGWAEKRLTADSDVEADIRRAVRDIFTRLPIKHKP